MTEEEKLLHKALVDREPDAPRALVMEYGHRLMLILKGKNSGIDEDTLQDAAHDALIALIEHPERFDPARGSLMNYLVHIAANKVKDSLRALYRERAHIDPFVELEDQDRNNYQEAWRPGQEEGLPEELEARIAKILPDPQDRRLLALIQEGRTPVADFAAVLGITNLPPAEQKAQVKRHRDRIIKRMRRHQQQWRNSP